MKLLHVGLNAETGLNNGLQEAFSKKYECYNIGMSHPDINKEIKRMVDSFKPDLMWMQIQTPNIIEQSTVMYAREKGVFIMNWMGDIRPVFPDWLSHLGHYVNLTCCSNMNYVDELTFRGVVADYLQTGYNSDVYKPEGDSRPIADIVFFGNNYKETFPLSRFRAEMVNFLKDNYYSFSAYGRGWKYKDGDYMKDPEGEAAIYRGAKVGINLSHFDYRRCSSSRLYRMMGCGTFCLTRPYPDMHKDFNIKEHLDTWRSLPELKNKIDYYLSESKIRGAIASNGQKLVSKNFTYNRMVDNIHKLYLKYKA